MSENSGESERVAALTEPHVIEHSEGKSITGSAQTIGLEPTPDFIAPTMALDSIDPAPDAD